jgi:hypothetical protein
MKMQKLAGVCLAGLTENNCLVSRWVPAAQANYLAKSQQFSPNIYLNLREPKPEDGTKLQSFLIILN